MLKQARDKIIRWGADGAPVFDLTSSLLEVIDAILGLDERIARFETGAAYEREAFDADARHDIAYAMSKFVDNGDGTLSWPKTSTGEVLQEAESKLSESDLISIRRAKEQANYLIEKLSDINFSSAHEAVRFAKDGIEHIIIDLDRFEDDSQ